MAWGRLLVVPLLGLTLAGCGESVTAVSDADVAEAAVCAQYPTSGTSCSSPDGAFSVTFTGTEPRGSIELSRGGARSVLVMYHSTNACCTDVTWAKPHTLLFDDDYQLIRLEPLTRTHTTIASWSDFVVSPDGRWIAGYSYVGGSAAPALTVRVLSVDGKTCLAVPHGSHESDSPAGFTRDGKRVIVGREPYDPGNGVTGGPSQLVSYAISSLPASKQC